MNQLVDQLTEGKIRCSSMDGDRGSRSLKVQYGAVQAVRGGCCGRVVLFLWKRDGWGKAVVGTGHPCTLPQQRSFQARTGTHDGQPCLLRTYSRQPLLMR